jgi:hypothetical protein
LANALWYAFKLCPFTNALKFSILALFFPL